MPVLATSTFLEVIFAMTIMVPIVILWVVAAVDVFRHGDSGSRIVAYLLLILVVPILGPILYFAFRRPDETTAEQQHMAEADMHRQAARRPIAGTRLY